MDKELIERIAVEEWSALNTGAVTDNERRTIVEFAKRVTTRIDAEHGKGAAFFVIEDEDGDVEFNKTNQFSGGRIGGSPLFLSPTIPEGFALVPKILTPAMRLAASDERFFDEKWEAVIKSVIEAGVQP